MKRQTNPEPKPDYEQEAKEKQYFDVLVSVYMMLMQGSYENRLGDSEGADANLERRPDAF